MLLNIVINIINVDLLSLLKRNYFLNFSQNKNHSLVRISRKCYITVMLLGYILPLIINTISRY